MADKKIDPRLYIPPVEGYSYDDSLINEASPEDAVAQESQTSPGTSGGLQPPGNVRVVEEIFRKGADGRVVVDLVLEIEDMPGALEYEVRLAAV